MKLFLIPFYIAVCFLLCFSYSCRPTKHNPCDTKVNNWLIVNQISDHQILEAFLLQLGEAVDVDMQAIQTRTDNRWKFRTLKTINHQAKEGLQVDSSFVEGYSSFMVVLCDINQKKNNHLVWKNLSIAEKKRLSQKLFKGYKELLIEQK